MRTFFSLLTALLVVSVTPTAQDLPLSLRAKAATAILVAQNASGDMDVRCTATAFKKNGSTYQFATAAHCIGSDNTAKERVAPWDRQAFYITFDEKETKVYFSARPKLVGYQSRGDDFAVFEVKAPKDVKWEVIELGDEGDEVEGNEVLNVAAPQGLGIQVFHGHISSLSLDRPVVQGDINWMGSMLLQLPGTDGGSSGSAIISLKQEKIVAFLVGTIGATQITARPVSRFKKLVERINAGTYRWMTKEEDQ